MYSSNLEAIAYTGHNLASELKSGDIGTTKEFDNPYNAPSNGKYFDQFIRDNYISNN